MIQQMLAIWSLVPLPFLKPAWTSGSSRFTYCWRLVWRILSTTLLACEMSAIVQEFEHSLALPFFGIGMKTDIFHSCGYCWVFQICWHIECSTFTASSFRIWNSSTGIPSPPLALLGLHYLGTVSHRRYELFWLTTRGQWLTENGRWWCSSGVERTLLDPVDWSTPGSCLPLSPGVCSNLWPLSRREKHVQYSKTAETANAW